MSVECKRITGNDIATAAQKTTLPAPLRVSVITTDDISAICTLSKTVFPENPTEASYLKTILTEGHGGGLVVYNAEQAQAFIFCEFNLKTKRGYISEITVLSELRGKGVARTLMNAMIDLSTAHGFKTMTSNIEINNTASIELHKRCGCEIAKQLDEYFDDGASAYYLKRSL